MTDKGIRIKSMDFLPISLLKVETVADRTKAFFFTKPDGFSFRAGQYVMIRIPSERLVEPDVRSGMRPISIASAPGDRELTFVMRAGSTGFKKTMWNLVPGETIGVGGPLGNATVPEEENRPIAILCGGVGIAPARSMIRDAVSKGDRRKYVLFSSNRTLRDAPCHEELLSTDLPGYSYVWTLTKAENEPSQKGEERGYITAEMIERHLPEWREALYYVIGAPAFADSMKSVLLGMGVVPENVHMDPFAGLTGSGSKNVA